MCAPAPKLQFNFLDFIHVLRVSSFKQVWVAQVELITNGGAAEWLNMKKIPPTTHIDTTTSEKCVQFFSVCRTTEDKLSSLCSILMLSNKTIHVWNFHRFSTLNSPSAQLGHCMAKVDFRAEQQTQLTIEFQVLDTVTDWTDTWRTRLKIRQRI